MAESGGDWSGTRAVVLGLGRQGVALVRYLVGAGAEVIASDLRGAEALREALTQLADLPVKYVLGGHPFGLLDRADLLLLSAGVPADAPIVWEATARGVELSNDSQLFLQACPAPVVAITGSAGKTTTTALVGQMCRAAGRRAWVGGNIGRSLLPDLGSIGTSDLVVMELSSFQLEIMTRGAQFAAVLNVTPNHLDRHESMEVYTAAKARLLEYQPAGGVAVLGLDDPGAWGLRSRVHGRLRAFSRVREVEEGAFLRGEVITLRGPDGERPVCRTGELRLRGRHNLLNVLAAAALADAVELPVQAVAEVARSFAGVEHRLELVRERDGVCWYDDSIATAPERLVAALRSFDQPLILLAGGRDKNLPWEEAAVLIQQRVRTLILFGEAADLIRSHLIGPAGCLEEIVQVDRLEEAVEAAASRAKPGDVVLLSPGGTSFDAYRDFEERGDHFQALVKRL